MSSREEALKNYPKFTDNTIDILEYMARYSDAIRTALSEPEIPKIEKIKQYRNKHQCSLLEAKYAIEALQHPEPSVVSVEELDEKYEGYVGYGLAVAIARDYPNGIIVKEGE